MKTRLIIFLAITTISCAVGCDDNSPKPLRGDRAGSNHPLSRTELDERPEMQFDPSQPYKLEFGRGSGMHGLETIVLNQSAKVTRHRMLWENTENGSDQSWETKTFAIDNNTYQRIGEAIRDLHILKMERAYHADVDDGTQWVFWLTQGNHTKTVYFNNHFPEQIQDFAVSIDHELKKAGQKQAAWTAVPTEEGSKHAKSLWGSIRD